MTTALTIVMKACLMDSIAIEDWGGVFLAFLALGMELGSLDLALGEISYS